MKSAAARRKPGAPGGGAAAGSESARRAEAWFRSRGLPFFVRREARGALLVARAGPFFVLLDAVAVGRWQVDTATVSIDTADPLRGLALLVLNGVVLAGVVTAPVAAYLGGGALARRHPRAAVVAGCGAGALYVFVLPWLPGHPAAAVTGADHAANANVIEMPGSVAATVQNAGIVAAALLLTWAGAGSLVGWTLRAAVRQLGALGALSTRALPLLMLVVVVSFFSRTLWEVTNGMSTARMTGMVALFVVLGLFFVVPVTRREMAGLAAEPELNRPERFNITVVLVLAQGVQVAVFSLLVCLFLVLLGEVAFTPAVLEAWLGTPREPFRMLDVAVPVDAALVKTAVFLSCVSSLNFLVSATTTASYRSAFYDPLFDDARWALAVRSTYHADAAHSRR